MGKLERKIARETKKQIFIKAKEVSDKLVLWNHPNKKSQLKPWDAQEVENLLWKYNKLDRLIYDRFGDDGWNHYKPSKFSEADINLIYTETRNLTIFLKQLETETKT